MTMNREAERLLLAGFVRFPDTYFEYSPYVSADDFSSHGAQMTYDVLSSLFVQKDLKSLSKNKIVAEARSLGYQNFLKATRDGAAIDEILDERIALEEVKNYFLAVKRESLKRQYIKQMKQVEHYLETTGDPLSKVISTVENSILSAVSKLDNGETGIRPLTQGIKDFIYGLADTPGDLGLDIGFPVFQNRIGQLRQPSVTFMVAHMKAGKSQYGLSRGLRVARKLKLPVLYIDTELSEPDQKVRTVGMLAEVPYDIIETGYWKLSEAELKKQNLDESDIAKILEYKRRMEDQAFWDMADSLPIYYLSVSGKSLDEVIPHMRRWVLTKVRPDPESKFPQCLIIYDYLKLSSFDEIRSGKVAEWQIHGLNYAALHDFSKKYHVPILAFGQTNNNSPDDESCIAGAKRIGENVTSASILRQKTEEEMALDSNGTHILKPFVTRHGAGLKTAGYINVDADLSIGKFTEIGLGTVNFAKEKEKQLAAFKEKQSAGKRKYKKHDDDDDD